MKDATIQITTKDQVEIYAPATSVAFVINNTGATIEKIELQTGKNIVSISKYSNKNYSIRVANGNNVTVKKI